MTRQAELQQWLDDHPMLSATAAFERAEDRLRGEIACLSGKSPEAPRPKSLPRVVSSTPSAIEPTLGVLKRVLPYPPLPPLERPRDA